MAAAPTPSFFCSAKPDGRAATELITFKKSNKKWVVEKVMLGVGALDRCGLLGVGARGGVCLCAKLVCKRLHGLSVRSSYVVYFFLIVCNPFEQFFINFAPYR